VTDYIPGAEPLFIDGNTRGCLLLHGGGGGTAWDLKEFANVLHQRTGMTVWLPSLTGYGTRPEDLYDVTLDDWLTDADSGLDRLLETCTQVFIVGHSVGGVLALITVSARKEVDGVVTWAAPHGIKSRLFTLLPALSKTPLLRRAIPERHDSPAPSWLKDKGWVGYEWIPTDVGLAMHDMLKRMKAALSSVTCPVLIIQGTADGSVSKDSAQRIYEGLGSEQKEFIMVEGAPHPIMTDERFKDDLFSHTIEFIQKL
jgi:carboxylesterase